MAPPRKPQEFGLLDEEKYHCHPNFSMNHLGTHQNWFIVPFESLTFLVPLQRMVHLRVPPVILDCFPASRRHGEGLRPQTYFFDRDK